MKSWFPLLRVSHIAVLSLLCFSGIGCAFTRTRVNVQLTPTASSPLDKTPAVELRVGEVKDTRPVKDGFVLSQKYNGYGQRTSGAYVAQEPVAQIFKQSLFSVLEKNGFITTGATNRLELRADIQEFSHDIMAGFLKATVQPKLIVRFELVETDSGRSVWHDTLIGRETLQTSWGTGAFLVETFNKAADDIFKQLISNTNFRNCISANSP
ncbi:MAG TPA: hypothetical protein VFW05_11725 [Verrucomicrobiae bacterium]|jgi:hypothetical protein|nr:hypothetical protein [Verrucomicrobiae bacterium]